MISLMAAVMVVQTGLVYNVQNKTSIDKACGAGAAAMLFIFQGAFTIGKRRSRAMLIATVLKLYHRVPGHSLGLSQ